MIRIENRESNAIIAYLVDKYDPAHTISVADGGNEKHIQLQWLYFQASGQGYVLVFGLQPESGDGGLRNSPESTCDRPYFGQAGWFILFHPEPVPSAIERYRKEILRVWGVLESVLATQEWLVDGRCTVADLSFIPYVLNNIAY